MNNQQPEAYPVSVRECEIIDGHEITLSTIRFTTPALALAYLDGLSEAPRLFETINRHALYYSQVSGHTFLLTQGVQ